MKPVNLAGATIPHVVESKSLRVRSSFSSRLRPARASSPLGGVRAVLEAAGVRDILTKSKGSSNPLNVVRATMQGLAMLKSAEVQAARRDQPVEKLLPFWSRTHAQ